MRLFVALDIEDDIRNRVVRFVEGVQSFAPEARWMPPESLHVTLKFIGEKSEDDVEPIKHLLGEIKSDMTDLNIRGYGFFPSAGAPRVFWVGIEAESKLETLASAVDERLASISISREEHSFSPHLTLARRGGGSGSPRRLKPDRPNRSFHLLREKLSALPPPEFGIMTAREFFLYQSHLAPKGSKYTKLATFPLHSL
jgi:2'-5' RNA ligase